MSRVLEADQQVIADVWVSMGDLVDIRYARSGGIDRISSAWGLHIFSSVGQADVAQRLRLDHSDL